MAGRCCLNCVYMCWDADRWLRSLAAGEPLVPRCANHPQWPGRLHEVSGTACPNYRPRAPEPAESDDTVRRIALANGRFAIVDAADYEWLSQYKWFLVGNGYAARREKGKTILMHREIMQAPEGMVVDHIDGNPMNSRRANLRTCTSAENMHNTAKRTGATSRFKGVYFNRRVGKWCARIQFKGKDFWLGYFDDELEAAHAYDRKAVELGIEFARLNFPEEWPPARRREVHAQWLRSTAGQEDKSPTLTKRRKPRAEERKTKSARATRHRARVTAPGTAARQGRRPVHTR